jgi:hypothetical protein
MHADSERIEAEGRQALADHAAWCGAGARERHGPIDHAALLRLLDDRQVVRYPVEIRFDASGLEPGEFAHAAAVGDHPEDGFHLRVHPYFRDRAADLPLLIAYHLVTVNYGSVATHEEAERFAAELLGMDREEYYLRVCALADELSAAIGANVSDGRDG